MREGVRLKKDLDDKSNQGPVKSSVFQIKGSFSSPAGHTSDHCDTIDTTPSIVWVSRDKVTSPSTQQCPLADRKCARTYESNNSKGDYCPSLNSVDGASSTQWSHRYSCKPLEDNLGASGSKDYNFSHARYQPSHKALDNYMRLRTGTKCEEGARTQHRDQQHCEKGDFSGREVSISAIDALDRNRYSSDALDRNRYPRGRSSDERDGKYSTTYKPGDTKPTSSKVMPQSDDSNLDEGYNDSLTSSLQKEKTSRRANKNRITRRVPRSSINTLSSQTTSSESHEYHTAVTPSASNPPAAAVAAAEANASKNCTCSRTDQRQKNCPGCLMERAALAKASNHSDNSLPSRNFQSSHKCYTSPSTSQPARESVDRGATTWNVRSSCDANRWTSPERSDAANRCPCSEMTQVVHRKPSTALTEISLPCGNKLVRCKSMCPRASLCAYIARYIWPKVTKAFVTSVRYGFIICVYLVLMFFVRRYITLNVFAHLTVLFLNILLMFILAFTPENMYIYLFGQSE
ncbi:unnamed protein product [Lymnaea stagnalis]|uniref:Uncharacterized protein n=1 Tax=Lymnaea stagnalis TaxID=6523 RepID=A0AAV2HSY5_LYMST